MVGSLWVKTQLLLLAIVRSELACSEPGGCQKAGEEASLLQASWHSHGYHNYHGSVCTAGANAVERSKLCAKHAPQLRTMEVMKSENGLLDVDISVDLHTIEFPSLGIKATMRLFNGMFPGPTLRVRRGDTVKVKLVNNLVDNAPKKPIPRREGQDHLQPSDIFYQDVGQVNKGSQTKMHPHMNNFHAPNNTNFHTHGFHVSPQLPQDNVIDVDVKPGESFQYSYELSAYHSGGTTWYHPHFHGATALQVGSGMAGTIVIEDSPGEVPDWIAHMREEILFIQQQKWEYFGPDYQTVAPNDGLHGCYPFGSNYTLRCAQFGSRTGLVAHLSGDDTYKVEYLPGFGFGPGQKTPVRSFITVNGQFAPFVDMETGEWVRFRVIFAAHHDAIQLVIPEDDCEMQLMVKDNAFLPEFPRKISKGMFFGPGNRAQVLVRCSKPGKKVLLQNFTANVVAPMMEDLSDLTQVVLHINVRGRERKVLPKPKVVKAQVPRYLQSLVSLSDSEIGVPDTDNPLRPAQPQVTLKAPDNMTVLQDQMISGAVPGDPLASPAKSYVDFPARFIINNETFALGTPLQFQATMPVGGVYQVEATGLQFHSWHMHTNPVQYVKFGRADYKDFWGGFFEVGDWQDTLLLPGACPNPGPDNCPESVATVRYQTDCYTGPMIIHCHALYHEDLGMFTMFNTVGKDHTVDPRFQNEGLFKHPPEHCLREGAQCALPWCTDYQYHRPDHYHGHDYKYHDHGYKHHGYGYK